MRQNNDAVVRNSFATLRQAGAKALASSVCGRTPWAGALELRRCNLGIRDRGTTKSALPVQPLHLNSTGFPANPMMAQQTDGPTAGVLVWTVPCKRRIGNP
jgi:hypothetical protein